MGCGSSSPSNEKDNKIIILPAVKSEDIQNNHKNINDPIHPIIPTATSINEKSNNHPPLFTPAGESLPTTEPQPAPLSGSGSAVRDSGSGPGLGLGVGLGPDTGIGTGSGTRPGPSGSLFSNDNLLMPKHSLASNNSNSHGHLINSASPNIGLKSSLKDPSHKGPGPARSSLILTASQRGIGSTSKTRHHKHGPGNIHGSGPMGPLSAVGPASTGIGPNGTGPSQPTGAQAHSHHNQLTSANSFALLDVYSNNHSSNGVLVSPNNTLRSNIITHSRGPSLDYITNYNNYGNNNNNNNNISQFPEVLPMSPTPIHNNNNPNNNNMNSNNNNNDDLVGQVPNVNSLPIVTESTPIISPSLNKIIPSSNPNVTPNGVAPLSSVPSLARRRNSSNAPGSPDFNNQLTMSKRNKRQVRRTSHGGMMASLALKFPAIRNSFLAVQRVFEEYHHARLAKESSNSIKGTGPEAANKHSSSVPADKKFNAQAIRLDQLGDVLEAITHRSRKFTEDQVRNLFKLADLDHSKTITFKEFLIAVAIGYFLVEDHPDQEFKSIAHGFKLVQQAFKDMDVDHSNTVDVKELKKALFAVYEKGNNKNNKNDDDNNNNEEASNSAKLLLELRFKELDFNGDGGIEFPEFLYGFISWVGFMDED